MSIENKINDLEIQVSKYESLSDYEKIMCNEYINIIDAKEECAYLLNDHKNNFNNANNENLDLKCDDIMFENIVDKINNIKQLINNTENLEEMIKMYEELCYNKKLLENYFKDKKMEIVYI
jgi:hypothetical protein